MDKISEILNSVKERVSNPLIFSFLVSWLVYNWKIPVALIWFDERQISANGCKSIFEFIDDELSLNGKFRGPFLFALFYTFVFPIIRNLISAFQSWVTRWGALWNFKILRNSYVSLEKYLSLRSEYISKIHELENIIESESQIRLDNTDLNSQKKELEDKIIELNRKNEFLEIENRQISNVKFLDGQWEFTTIDASNIKNKESIYIKDGKLFTLTKEGDRIDKNIFIENFYINKSNNSLVFIKKKGTNYRADYFNKHLINVLRIEGDNLNGTENGKSVEYIKIN